MIAGILLSVLGAALKAASERRYAQRRKEARDAVMNRQLARTDELAKDSRSQLNARLEQAQPAAVEDMRAAAEADRGEELYDAVDPGVADTASLSGSAPEVVRSEIASKLLEAFKEGRDQAGAMAKASSYGDGWQEQGFLDAGTGQGLGVNANFANSIFGLMPHQQDIAENRVRPGMGSVIGDILGGIGGFMGSRAGGGAGGIGGGAFGRRSRITGGSGNDRFI